MHLVINYPGSLRGPNYLPQNGTVYSGEGGGGEIEVAPNYLPTTDTAVFTDFVKISGCSNGQKLIDGRYTSEYYPDLNPHMLIL